MRSPSFAKVGKLHPKNLVLSRGSQEVGDTRGPGLRTDLQKSVPIRVNPCPIPVYRRNHSRFSRTNSSSVRCGSARYTLSISSI